MTPAIDLLNRQHIDFAIHEYEHDPDSESYGMEAAEKLGLDPLRVYKTLVVSDERKRLFVAMVPVAKQLNLKKLAAALKVKKVTMAEKKLVERVSGYVVGGVSPIAQKKRLQTVLDERAFDFETLYVSGGKRGLDLELAVTDLVKLLDADTAAIASDT